MASSTSGSALEEIFADKQLFEAHFGFSCEEVVLDSDESDLEVDLSEDDSDGGNGISLQMTINWENGGYQCIPNSKCIEDDGDDLSPAASPSGSLSFAVGDAVNEGKHNTVAVTNQQGYTDPFDIQTIAQAQILRWETNFLHHYPSHTL